LVPGDSGSPVIETIGDQRVVAGMATSRTPADRYATEQDLAPYGVSVNHPVGGEGQMPLGLANATPPSALRAALAAAA
jgi:hypothetical protein